MRPYVVIFFTQSIDGKIAAVDGYSKLSCEEDKRRQFWLRCAVDGVVVGANTVIADNPRLYPKLCLETKSRYFRIVIDGKLRIPLDARILDTSRFGTIVITSKCAPADKVRELRKMGVEVIMCGDGERIDIHRALEMLLKEFGIEKIMVEGGGSTIWSFVSSGAFDEVRVTISPVIFGGAAVSSVSGEGFRGRDAPKLDLVFAALCKCGSEIHLVYRNPSPVGHAVARGVGTLNNFSRILIDRGELVGGRGTTSSTTS